MARGLDGLTSLSRASDHLGNLANILKDLGGGATLLHELTQNAKDAQAHTIRFACMGDELVVWNSSTFTDCSRQDLRLCPWKTRDGRRSCDLHSFRQVAGRHKAEDDATTGAFGVGFTAVYQVTDHPELVTNGSHLVLDESRPEDERIQICPGGCSRDHELVGTTLFLPWAREATALRQALGAAPLDEADVEELTNQLHEASRSALVFLDPVKRLEIESPGRRTLVLRSQTADRVRIKVNDELIEWLLLEGEVEGADEVKQQYDQTGSGRSSTVQVAVPVGDAIGGRIYADLPTETRTGWSGHINGTFFPRQDRKTVEFDGRGFRGKWNDLLIDTAARLVAEGLESIASEVGHDVAWTYLVDVEQVNRDIVKGEYPRVFSSFFARAKELVPTARIVLLADGRSVMPRGVIVPRDEVGYDAAQVLMRLGLHLVDPSIRPHALQTSLTQYGMHQLGVSDVVDALARADVVEPWKQDDEDAVLDDSDVEAILHLLDHLRQRGKTLLTEGAAAQVAIIPCVNGFYAPADDVSRLEDADDLALFELLAPELKILDAPRLMSLCPGLVELCHDISASRAIEIFESDPKALAVAPDQVLEWLANHRGALRDEGIRDRARELPIFPSADGTLKPLSALSLSSNFVDVLRVADVVDHAQTAGYTDLLRLLGARELDAVEYLGRHVVGAAANRDLTLDQATDVLEIIHQHRAELDQSPETRATLCRAPLVGCTDGALRPAAEVHLPNRALTLIAPDAAVAKAEGLPAHLVDTLVWLGVHERPNHGVLDAAARRLGQQTELPDGEIVLAVLDALPNPPDTADVPLRLSGLLEAAWLPCEGGSRGRPSEVFAVFQRYLFESQGKKLDLPREDQQRLNKVLDWLGVQSTPPTGMVIAHLRHCAKTGTPMNEEVYRALGQAREESLVATLSGEPCIQISPGAFVEPAYVFWSDPGLGEWAHQLSPGRRQHQAFFERVGVREWPSPGQIEQTLRKISRVVGNDWLDDDTKRVVHRCWELLDEQLEDAKEVLTRLGFVKSALGPRGLLEKPELLLFADGRRLAETILLIKNNLIRRDRTTHRALTAAGVRAAEEVITAHVDPDVNYLPAQQIPNLINDRLPALERLAEAQRSEGATYDLNTLKTVRFDVMPDLTVQYVTRFAHQHQVDPPRPTEAIYLPEDKRVIIRSEEEPTRHLAREISLCIAPEIDVSTSAPSILEILRASSLSESMAVLDEYGVRDLDEAEWEVVPTAAAEGAVDSEESALVPGTTTTHRNEPTEGEGARDGASTRRPTEGRPPDRSPEAGTARGSERFGEEDEAEHRAHDHVRPQTKRHVPRTSRLTSYVVSGESDREATNGDEATKGGSIDQAGVRRVLEHETLRGRDPEVQAHTNPGFDVLSRNSDGEVVRRIEIKSIGGPWTERGVLLSTTQYEDARRNSDTFWLYVVEHAEDDDAFVIHRIQNPVGRITKYGFDCGWQALDEPTRRHASGPPPNRSTRTLLGLGANPPTGSAPQVAPAGDRQDVRPRRSAGEEP